MNLVFVTSNELKLLLAKNVCERFGVHLDHTPLDLQEVQSDSGEEIARHKARQAFQKLQKPVVVNDDSWLIPGLNGFPGPYMKYVNKWFTPDDFARLTTSLADRRIILRQISCYQDAEQQKIFSVDIEGVLLKTPRGTSKFPHFTITSYDGGKHSAAEINTSGYTAIDNHHTAWHDLCEWLLKRK